MESLEKEFERITQEIRNGLSPADPKRGRIAENFSALNNTLLPKYAVYSWNSWGDGITDNILFLDFGRWKKLLYTDWQQIYDQLNKMGKYHCEFWTGRYLGINLKENKFQTYTTARFNTETNQAEDEKTHFLFIGATDESHRVRQFYINQIERFGLTVDELKEYNSELVKQGGFRNHL